MDAIFAKRRNKFSLSMDCGRQKLISTMIRCYVERFNTCVPVVEIDGKIRFRGRVNKILLRRIVK